VAVLHQEEMLDPFPHKDAHHQHKILIYLMVLYPSIAQPSIKNRFAFFINHLLSSFRFWLKTIFLSESDQSDIFVVHKILQNSYVL
jgi:hypothetical protein